MQYLFILAISRLPLNTNNHNSNGKNVQIFCYSHVVDAFRENIATVKVMNHLNKRCMNVKSRMILKSKIVWLCAIIL